MRVCRQERQQLAKQRKEEREALKRYRQAERERREVLNARIKKVDGEVAQVCWAFSVCVSCAREERERDERR